MKYDSIIVGAGPAGYFCAYEMVKKNPNHKVLLIDKGNSILDRHCPLIEHKLTKCPVNKKGKIGCYPACSVISGFGGAGAFSDGKFNITSEFGGWLTDYLDEKEVIDLINYVDSINLAHGATPVITDPYTNEVRQIEKTAASVGIKLLRAKVRHLGTEENIRILASIFAELKDKITFIPKTFVTDIKVIDGEVKGVYVGEELIEGNNVVLAVGRDGSEWLNEIYEKYDIKTTNNQVDIGVRVETSDIVMQDINKYLYEAKMVYRTSQGTTVRTFCSNPSGYVVTENNSGVVNVNGHSYSSSKLASSNTNFALLVSHKFDAPFNNPNHFAKEISELGNQLTLGSVIVQKYGDILKGRRTTKERLDEGFIKPTLKEAVPGDLGLCLPYKTMASLIEMMEALDKVTPGIATEHTLFYGVEAKFYSARPVMTKGFMTKDIKNLYIIGDGAGLTRGLAQAGANGVYVAREILKK